MTRNHRLQTGFWVAILFLISRMFDGAAAQETQQPSGNRIGHLLKKNVQISGSTELSGELYGIDGAPRRRPPSLGRIYANPRLQITEYVSMPITLLLSTEGSYLSRDMNIVGLHPTWRWGRAHIGDFSAAFSKYSFSGINVEGGGLELWPSRFRFGAGSGRTHRATTDIHANQRFAQHLYTGKMGVALGNGTFFDFIVLKVKDDKNSLKPENYRYAIPDTLENEADTLWIDKPYNAVTPQENLLAGVAGRIDLMQNRLSVDFEGIGSAFTRDINLNPIDMDSLDAPKLLKGLIGSIYEPRTSTNIDFASNLGIHLRLDKLNFVAGYTYIGPGYVSLGIPSTVNDRREFLVNTTFKLNQNILQFGWNRKSNNVLDQKLSSNVRNQYRIGLNRNMKKLRSSFDVNFLSMNTISNLDTLELEYSNFIFNMHQALAFDRSSMIRQVGIRYTYQTSHKNASGTTSRSNYHTLSLTGTMRASEQLTINGSAGYSFRRSEAKGFYSTQVYSLRTNFFTLNKKLSSSFLISSSMVRDMNVYRAGLDIAYQLTERNAIKTNLSYTAYDGKQSFREMRTGLSLSHRL